MTISMKAKKIKRVVSSAEHCAQGWWYENRGSIEIYLRDDSAKTTLYGKIPRALLVDWIKRTATSTR